MHVNRSAVIGDPACSAVASHLVAFTRWAPITARSGSCQVGRRLARSRGRLILLRSLVGRAIADGFGKFGGGYFLAACEYGVGLCEPAHCAGVPHDGQGFLQPLQVLDGDQHGGRAAVDGDGHSLMVVMYASDELRQVGLYFCQWQRRHGQKLDQKIGGSQTRGPDASYPPVGWTLALVARQWHTAGTKGQSAFRGDPRDGRYRR